MNRDQQAFFIDTGLRSMAHSNSAQRYHTQASGFTLIELILAIVMIGLLSAIASTKFFDLSSSATTAKLQGMLGAIRGATLMARAQGTTEDVIDGTITVEGRTVNIVGRYPTAEWSMAFEGLLNNSASTETVSVATCTTAWCTQGNIATLGITGANTSNNLKVWPKGKSSADNCYVWYHNGYEGAGADEIASGIINSGC